MATVALNNLTKQYGNGAITAVKDLSLDIADGEFLVLVGPSGCGKSTALRMIAGLEEITGGEVSIAGNVVNDVHARDRDIAMVFQNYALYPHMSVFDNMAFALQIAKLPTAQIEQKVNEVAAILQLEPYLKRRPGQLSGGQRQRVAMGRAIVRQPAVFLMDEPLSNLDAKLRVQMRSEIARIQDRLGVTTIYVTHDQVEAMTMGDRVALLKDGMLQQVDTPSNIYDRPANTFVASFIGSPAMNLFHAHLGQKTANGAPMQLGSHSLQVPATAFEQRPELENYVGREIIAGIRPEDMEDVQLRPDHPKDQTLSAKVILAEALGSDNIIHLDFDAKMAEVIDPDTLSDISKSLDKESVGICVARFDAKSKLQTGEIAEVTVDCERLHFFDAESGLAVARK
ncbi:sn-glycerol-3-phosphate ABC transporter ATP-binding protein UgpC [Devosia algicola]|uniref:Sn-glycerol-3-phosphate ABC transporter ATP-binding protein UgpC n=1 Tax=Devosia algicola TaxID=3026418 RepID=A0ABY7YSK3_9HYPH|nr:sn-glycerol-3-phosphate ABC transporter ATP-binding protein UgpC [Devosia algicola]WDR04234.1 sn-glycerol-3-phosphate ABC transporter ATP-binding protein UgpC [Devosia algicola]